MRSKAMFAVATVLGLVAFFVISICSPLAAQMKKVMSLEGVKFDTSSLCVNISETLSTQ